MSSSTSAPTYATLSCSGAGTERNQNDVFAGQLAEIDSLKSLAPTGSKTPLESWFTKVGSTYGETLKHSWDNLTTDAEFVRKVIEFLDAYQTIETGSTIADQQKDPLVGVGLDQ